MVFADDDIRIYDNEITSEEQRQIAVQFNAAIWRYGWPRSDAYFSRPCWHVFIAGTRRPEGECCADELAMSPEWGFLSSVWRRIKELHIPNATLWGYMRMVKRLVRIPPFTVITSRMSLERLFYYSVICIGLAAGEGSCCFIIIKR